MKISELIPELSQCKDRLGNVVVELEDWANEPYPQPRAVRIVSDRIAKGETRVLLSA